MADSILPPIDWIVFRVAPAGSRTYTGPEVGAKAAWACPACGEQNTGLLADGCTSCGNGGGAKHVGVDPIVVKAKAPAVVNTVRPAEWMTVGGSPDSIDRFHQWVAQAQRVDLQSAFLAGWEAANRERMTNPVTDHPENVPTVAAVVDPTEASTEGNLGEPLPGTAKDRTLLAALEFFKDQVYSVDAEEAISGEWVGAFDLDAWIIDVRARIEDNHE